MNYIVLLSMCYVVALILSYVHFSIATSKRKRKLEEIHGSLDGLDLSKWGAKINISQLMMFTFVLGTIGSIAGFIVDWLVGFAPQYLTGMFTSFKTASPGDIKSMSTTEFFVPFILMFGLMVFGLTQIAGLLKIKDGWPLAIFSLAYSILMPLILNSYSKNYILVSGFRIFGYAVAGGTYAGALITIIISISQFGSALSRSKMDDNEH